ncbi:unnamed protein product [Pedinophyceae sp. YPF-701]|nr:unnamed protein product [Pedinophyceae sp. YPF-701]
MPNTLRCGARQAATAVGSDLAPVIDISSYDPSQRADPALLESVRVACEHTGFLTVLGHGADLLLAKLCMELGAEAFDLPMERKRELIVQDMTVGRGYEISPEHRRYAQHFVENVRPGHCCWRAHPEPSAQEGILSERLMCGPTPGDPERLGLPADYFTSDLGQAFFAPNAWPDAEVPKLSKSMMRLYRQLDDIASRLLLLFAEALDADREAFARALAGHHSNMQVANYPSLLSEPGPDDIRKKAHTDSGTMTLLLSDGWMRRGHRRQGAPRKGPGLGGLELYVGGEWVPVRVEEGAILVNIGSLLTVWTNGLWKSTLHRVTNPDVSRAEESRRISIAFFQKPNYNTVVEPLPSCVARTGGAARFEATPVSGLTRQGIMHSLRHLPAEEASARYHELMLKIRDAQGS